MKKNLIYLDSIDEVIKDYIHENRLDSEEEESDHISRIVNLAIDSFAFKSFSTTALTNSKDVKVSKDGKSITFNNVFLYMMIPIDFRLPPKVLHIEKWCNGFYNDFIDEIAENITNSLINNGFKVYYKSTDGDKYLSNDHEVFYLTYIDSKSENFLELVTNVYLKLSSNDELSIPVNDPLHLWKSIRSRFQLHPIFLFDDSPFTTSYEKVEEILEIGKALKDTSSTGKMRDAYSLQLFTFENLLK